MREVLASLKPYYYYLVGEGIKEVEVRKSIPKSNDWDKKVFFYMSKDEKSFAKIPKEYQEKYRRHFGKVGLQFVCDSVYEWKYRQLQGLNGTINTYFPIFVEDLLKTCLTHKDLENYGKRKTLYGWHISNLVIYDKPKELSEFWTVKCTNKKGGCIGCEAKPSCIKILSRPPQSWCYVEENENERN